MATKTFCDSTGKEISGAGFKTEAGYSAKVTVPLVPPAGLPDEDRKAYPKEAVLDVEITVRSRPHSKVFAADLWGAAVKRAVDTMTGHAAQG